MNECTYKNYDELPLMLNVVQVSSVLGISRAGAYELVHSEGFPALKIGSRIVVPKDKLREWIDASTTQKWPRCNQRATAIFFLHFLAVFSGFLSILIPFLTSCDLGFPCVPHLSVAFYVVKGKASPE